jgi:type IV pilus assembly protein PilC
MEFVCKVGTPSGEVVEKVFVAPDEAALRTDLEQQGFYLFQARSRLGLSAFKLGRRGISTEQLMIFGQELAALLKAGLPLFQSLDVMLERQKDPVFHRSLEAIRERVRSGVALSEAFRAEGNLYPPMLGASIVAGERSGSLEVVLRRFVQYLRLNQALKKKAVAASVYPALLFTLMCGLISIMVVKVIPTFEQFYEGFDVELPLATRVIMGFSHFVTGNLAWILLIFVGTVLGTTFWLRQEGSAKTIDWILLRVPYLGGLMLMYATSQLCRTLATLLGGGLPLLQALDVAAASMGNRALGEAVARATPLIREGKSLTFALESTGLLENLTLEMVKVGEQTGALGDMLASIADFYDEEMDTRLATVLALVEPIMLMCMAVIVAGMLMAFYLPLFQAISAIEGGRH